MLCVLSSAMQFDICLSPGSSLTPEIEHGPA